MGGIEVSSEPRAAWANRARFELGGSVFVIGSHQSGKTTLIEACEEALHLDLHPFSWEVDENHETIADKSAIISELLQQYTDIPKPTDEAIEGGQDAYIAFLARVVSVLPRRQAWLMQGKRRTPNFETAAEQVADALSQKIADSPQNFETAAEQVVAALSQKIADSPQNFETAAEQVVAALSQKIADSPQRRTLLIFENWPLRPRRVSRSNSKVIPIGVPPVKRPSLSESSPSGGNGSKVTSTNKNYLTHPRGLTREEAIAYIRNKVETSGDAQLKGNRDSVSSAIYRCAGGHIGAINLVLESMFEQLDSVHPKEKVEALRTSTDLNKVTDAIKACLRAHNTGTGNVFGFVEDLMTSVGVIGLVDDHTLPDAAELQHILGHESLEITVDDDGPPQQPICLFHLFKRLRDLLEGVDPMDPIIIDPATLNTVMIPALATLVTWITPGMQTLSTEIGKAFGEVAKDRIFQQFQTRVEEEVLQNDGARPPVEEISSIIIDELGKASNTQQAYLLEKTKRGMVQLLRDPDLFSDKDIKRYWQDYRALDNKTSAKRMWKQADEDQSEAAHQLVDEATRSGRLPDLMNAMGQKLALREG